MRNKLNVTIFSTFLIFTLRAHADTMRVQILSGNKAVRILNVYKSNKNVKPGEKVLLTSIPYELKEGEPSSVRKFEEYLVNTPEISAMEIKTKELPANYELRTLVNQGPKENRINLTILGDGYTLAEKDKFFKDAERTTHNLFTGSTYASYLPLFNVYAIFVPSNQSGIGEGEPQDTAFKLYRTPAHSKRIIMPGDETALENALQYAPATDYPVVLANDDYYGGLGGRYAISTSSEHSGMIVLRHELGHNFGAVGEEYDNGYLYIGANSSETSNVGWQHWVNGPLKVYESKLLSGDYVWQNLNNNPYSTNFTAAADHQVFIQISTVGWQTPQDVISTLDGSALELKGNFTRDREFYNLAPMHLAPGSHNLSVKENLKDHDHILAFALIYSLPNDYDFTPKKIEAFETYDNSGHKYYRPTHSSCLMRDMTVDYFCSVDKENMWHRFLQRVSLIDDLHLDPTNKTATLLAPKLAGLTIKWFAGDKELTPYQNKLAVPTDGLSGPLKAQVSFKTDEVRIYNEHFTSEKTIQL